MNFIPASKYHVGSWMGPIINNILLIQITERTKHRNIFNHYHSRENTNLIALQNGGIVHRRARRNTESPAHTPGPGPVAHLTL